MLEEDKVKKIFQNLATQKEWVKSLLTFSKAISYTF